MLVNLKFGFLLYFIIKYPINTKVYDVFIKRYLIKRFEELKQKMFTKFLVGKTAVVTGSLSGIGLGIAKTLSAAGANIALNGFASA